MNHTECFKPGITLWPDHRFFADAAMFDDLALQHVDHGGPAIVPVNGDLPTRPEDNFARSQIMSFQGPKEFFKGNHAEHGGLLKSGRLGGAMLGRLVLDARLSPRLGPGAPAA